MTLKPKQLGDKGQRYEIRFRDVDDPLTLSKTLGWSDDYAKALELAKSWKKRPSTENAWVCDRGNEYWED